MRREKWAKVKERIIAFPPRARPSKKSRPPGGTSSQPRAPNSPTAAPNRKSDASPFSSAKTTSTLSLNWSGSNATNEPPAQRSKKPSPDTSTPPSSSAMPTPSGPKRSARPARRPAPRAAPSHPFHPNLAREAARNDPGNTPLKASEAHASTSMARQGFPLRRPGRTSHLENLGTSEAQKPAGRTVAGRASQTNARKTLKKALERGIAGSAMTRWQHVTLASL